jgi:hypothetical protein
MAAPLAQIYINGRAYAAAEVILHRRDPFSPFLRSGAAAAARASPPLNPLPLPLPPQLSEASLVSFSKEAARTRVLRGLSPRAEDGAAAAPAKASPPPPPARAARSPPPPAGAAPSGLSAPRTRAAPLPAPLFEDVDTEEEEAPAPQRREKRFSPQKGDLSALVAAPPAGGCSLA